MECSDNMIALKLTEEEYINRLKLRLAMEDVLSAYYVSKDSEVLGEKVIEIIEGWEL